MPAAARLGDKAQVDADAHGCPACPHPGVGPIVTASTDVFVNKKGAARQDDLGIHAVCCRSEEHTSELQSQSNLVCRLLLEKKKKKRKKTKQKITNRDNYNI